AYKEFPKDKESFSAADENGLVLLGYLAFFDPPKESSAQAIKALSEAGVAVKILTGDNELVTRNVCRNVGLAVDTVITGAQLAGLSEEQLCTTVMEGVAFARLSPMQKETI